MYFNDHNAAPPRSVVSLLGVGALMLAALCAAPAAYAVDGGDIVVTALKGEVHVTMHGAERAVRAGSVLELPATVRTGRDGAIDLRQGPTTVSVGPDTQLEFPSLEVPGGPVERIQQPRGNVFYDVGKRGSRKLRIETPFLVAVVKGTQFNVAARDDASTIALFEGQLEIRSTDGSDVVDLAAGEIASRHRDERDIGVIRMDAPGPKPAPAVPSGAEGGDHGTTLPAAPRPDPVEVGEQFLADVRIDLGATDSLNLVAFVEPESASGMRDLPIDSGAGLVAGSGADSGGVAEAIGAVAAGGISDGSVAVDMGPGVGAITVDAGVTDGAGSADAGIEVGVGGGAIDVGAGITDGAVSVDAGAGLGDGLVDAGAGATVDLGGGAVNVDLGTNVNVGGVDVGVDVDLGIDLDDDDGNSGHGNSNGYDEDNSGRGNSKDRDKDSGLLGEITEEVINLLDGMRKPGKK